MEQIFNIVIAPLNDILWSYILVFFLIILGVYFTVKTKFVQFRLFPHMLKLLTESTGHRKDKSISSFQAFCIGSTASRVGTGNLTGIALAIVAGGPGAIFWMWCLALLGCGYGFHRKYTCTDLQSKRRQKISRRSSILYSTGTK